MHNIISKSNSKSVPLIGALRQLMCRSRELQSNNSQMKWFQSLRCLSVAKGRMSVQGSFQILYSPTNVQNLKMQHLYQIRHISVSEKRLKQELSAADMKKAMDQLTEQFMEARELIEDARESMETVYFSDDMAEAQEAVTTTLDQYQKLLSQLSESQRQEVLRTIGLRMEELKAQEQALKDAVLDSH